MNTRVDVCADERERTSIGRTATMQQQPPASQAQQLHGRSQRRRLLRRRWIGVGASSCRRCRHNCRKRRHRGGTLLQRRR